MDAQPETGFDPARLVLDTMVALESDGVASAAHRFLSVLRDGEASATAPRVERLCDYLELDPSVAHAIGDALRRYLVDLRVGPALIDSGIVAATGFFTELAGRVSRRFVPDLDQPGDLRTALREHLPLRDAHQRVESVPDVVWIRLLTALGLTADRADGVDPELHTAVRTLAHHIGSVGMQPELIDRLPHLENPDSPFVILSDHVLAHLRSMSDPDARDEGKRLAEAFETIGRCRAEVRHLRASKHERGTSLHLTGLTFRLLQLLDRLETLLHLTEPRLQDSQTAAIRLFREITVAESQKNRVLPHLRERADLLAYQVVEHAAKKGSKYITSGRSDWMRFFLASLGGGFIVAVFSFFKTYASAWEIPLGLQAIVYGINYSLCFVLIYLTGAALATKQPAMTANTIAKSLGNPSDRSLDRLEALVVRVWRSQFISFVGNLAMALPVALILSELFLRTSGAPVASPADAEYMLGKLHPWQSGSLIFAAIAGAFLFLAGLISGWVDNRNLYTRFPERVARHPLLLSVLGADATRWIGDFLDRNLGVLVGNVFLGFALGSTGTLGEILGLPLDIRHIAFASAEFGTSLEILRFDVAASVILQVGLGVVLIGLVNFLVSFGLSLFIGLESRRITGDEVRDFARDMLRRLRERPLEWFVPPPDTPQPVPPDAPR